MGQRRSAQRGSTVLVVCAISRDAICDDNDVGDIFTVSC